MKKTYFAAALVAFASVMTAPAQAATVDSSFTVSVLLQSRCVAINSGTTTLNFGTYDAINNAIKSTSVQLDFNCTRGLAAPTFTFDAINGTATGAASTSATGDGVLAGLNYHLVADNSVATSAGASATSAAGVTGGPDVKHVKITGTMAAYQAGHCTVTDSASASCDASAQTHTRTLTITY